MTKTVFLKRDGKFCGFSVSGHSGYADAGSDIICASVSSYVNMTVALLEKSGVAIDIKTDESIPSVTVNTKSDVADTVIGVLYECLDAVSREYGKYLLLNVKE